MAKDNQAKKLYLAGGAVIGVVAFLISLTFLVTGIVSLVNPSELAYPRTLAEYKERYTIYDETGVKTGNQYTDEEMKAMWEEEKAMENAARKKRYINQIAVSGVVLVFGGMLWASHWDRLKKDSE